MSRHIEPFDLEKVEREALSPLKDFQKRTVNRVYELFRAKHNRVLVADEVGLGKTVIARGVIARMARLRKIYENDEFFRVAYICSNQNIANQNLSKLRIVPQPPRDKNSKYRDDVSEMRLTMQHLRSTEDMTNPAIRANYIQLIPLTPETSFRLSGGCGTVRERALMAVVLERMPELRPYRDKIRKQLRCGVKKQGWTELLAVYEGRVRDCEAATNGTYPQNVIDDLRRHGCRVVDVVRSMIGAEGCPGVRQGRDSAAIQTLRRAFAEISVEMLNPDLVIMDEFQRYRFLLESEKAAMDETGILARRFLKTPSQDRRVLLLSATPFKYYETAAERLADDTGGAYQEFLDLLGFLFEAHADEVKSVWRNYSNCLQEITFNSWDVVRVAKEEAQEALYGGVCRTERISVMKSAEYMLNTKTTVEVSEDDIAGYLQFSRLLQRIGYDGRLLTSFAKSCPLLLSYMSGYKQKEEIEGHFKRHRGDLALISRGTAKLWLTRKAVRNYQKLSVQHAKLSCLMGQAFRNGSERYLWVPPSKPYYPLAGAYAKCGTGNERFSKVLVFSSWEMVPRMIASLVSYEAERLTIRRRYDQERGKGLKDLNYFDKSRYPRRRLVFALKGDDAASMSILTLLYPSRTLCGIYDPLASFLKGQSLDDIRNDFDSYLVPRVRELRRYAQDGGPVDQRWFYLTPMLLDGVETAVKWAREELYDAVDHANRDSEDENASASKDRRGLKRHCERLLEELAGLKEGCLGPMPDEKELVEALVDMCLASPAVCALRSNGGRRDWATELAAVFIQVFNTPTATAIVDLATGRFKDDVSRHWRNVLRYCKDGCFPAMLDEYRSVLWDDVSFLPAAEREERLHRKMCDSLLLKSTPCVVDTVAAFCARATDRRRGALDPDDDSKQMRLRTHYAVGFIKGRAQDAKSISRKENIRAAFNSPLRPFVLASTSIGQEGLDFHPYCRKVFHWNLPSNPIDLEQREGRVNRYKCLAVRQNVADSFLPGKDAGGNENLWSRMYKAAQRREKQPGQSDLVPFWCFGERQKTQVERIVPLYPYSRDVADYERLIRILSYYRLALGQPRQEELLEHVLDNVPDSEKPHLKDLLIDLSPFHHSSIVRDGRKGTSIVMSNL